jgi:protoheme IX farnesyltransferase
MRRLTQPAPTGYIPQRNVLLAGLLTSIIGVGWALLLSLPYGEIVFAGWFFDVIVYSVWLKRRTCWSIVWGGVAGAMPVLSGVLAVGGSMPLACWRHPCCSGPHTRRPSA